MTPRPPRLMKDWNAAFLAGYTNVVTGNASGQTGILPSSGRAGQSPVYVYLAADFTGAASGKYSTTVWFDLYDATPPPDSVSPVITHTPINEIDMIGNLVRIQIAVTDNVRVANAKLYYRKPGAADYKVAPFILRADASLTYRGSVNIMPSAMGDTGLQYYITASDGLNQTSWKKRLFRLNAANNRSYCRSGETKCHGHYNKERGASFTRAR